VWINHIRYADDTVLIADKVEDLQEMLGIVGECSIKSIGLNINTKKIKFMIITGKTQELQPTNRTWL